MCRNHSHLIAQFAGEDTSTDVPILMFVLAQDVLTIEMPVGAGTKIQIQTSGALYVPSWLLAGSVGSTVQATAARSMCLSLLPEYGATTTPQRITAWWSSAGISPTR
jgi:hypothetical protein